MITVCSGKVPETTMSMDGCLWPTKQVWKPFPPQAYSTDKGPGQQQDVDPVPSCMVMAALMGGHMASNQEQGYLPNLNSVMTGLCDYTQETLYSFSN